MDKSGSEDNIKNEGGLVRSDTELENELNALMETGKSHAGAQRAMKHRYHPDKKGGNEEIFKRVCNMDTEEMKMKTEEEGTSEVCLGLYGNPPMIHAAITKDMDFRPIDCLCNVEKTTDAPEFKSLKINYPSALWINCDDENVSFHAGGNTLNTKWSRSDNEIKVMLRMKTAGLKILSFNPKMPITKGHLETYKIFPEEMIDIPIILSKLKTEITEHGMNACILNSCIPKKTDLEKIKMGSEETKDIVITSARYIGKDGGSHTVEMSSPHHELRKCLTEGRRLVLSKSSLISIEYMKVNSLLRMAGLPTVKDIIGTVRNKRNNNRSSVKRGAAESVGEGARARKKTKKNNIGSGGAARYKFAVVAPPNGQGGYAIVTEDMGEYNKPLRDMLVSGHFELTESQKDAVFDMRKSGSDWGYNDKDRTLVYRKEYDIIIYRETRKSDPYYKIAPRSVISHRISAFGTPNPQFYRRVRVMYNGTV